MQNLGENDYAILKLLNEQWLDIHICYFTLTLKKSTCCPQNMATFLLIFCFHLILKSQFSDVVIQINLLQPTGYVMHQQV